MNVSKIFCNVKITMCYIIKEIYGIWQQEIKKLKIFLRIKKEPDTLISGSRVVYTLDLIKSIHYITLIIV